MKTKLLIWCAILFFALGLKAQDSALFYFFSIHLFMLFIGVHLHRLTQKQNPPPRVDPLAEATESN